MKFVWNIDNKGNWFWKAKNIVKPFKKDGDLKKEYKDLPRYPVIYDYEADWKKDYDKILKGIAKDVSNKMKSFIK